MMAYNGAEFVVFFVLYVLVVIGVIAVGVYLGVRWATPRLVRELRQAGDGGHGPA